MCDAQRLYSILAFGNNFVIPIIVLFVLLQDFDNLYNLMGQRNPTDAQILDFFDKVTYLVYMYFKNLSGLLVICQIVSH